MTWAPIRKILTALDESPRAPLVFEAATSLAQQLNAEVILLRVLTVPPDLPPAAHTHPDHLEERLEMQTADELQRLAASAPGVAFSKPVVVEGDPWRQILAVATALNVDLIVLGSHGYHGLDRVLGTVAAKVVNHADRDVLVVHARRAPPPAPAPPRSRSG
jgi:nucleotide-binding universal stress UspA family protein